MFTQIIVGMGLMALTTFVHAVCTGLLVRLLGAVRAKRWGLRSGTSESLLVAGVVVLLLLAGLLEASIWAAAYMHLEVVSSAEEALYFSIVSFTTLGFGDITLDESWRLLSSLEAANGIILFGWSTALVFSFIQYVFRHKLPLESAKKN